MAKVLDILKREHGVTSIEYALIAVGVAVAIVVVVKAVGVDLTNLYRSVADITWTR